MEKKYIFLSFLVLITFLSIQTSLIAQAHQTLWSKSYGGSNNDEIYDIIQTSDGGYVGVGFTRSNDGDIPNSEGGSDIWVIKLNASGDLIWSKTFGSSSGDGGRKIFELDNGNLLLFATIGYPDKYFSTLNTQSNKGGVVMMKLNANGQPLSVERLGGLYGGWIDDVVKNNNDEFLVRTFSSNNSNLDAVVYKVDINNNLLWMKSYGGSDDELLSCIKATKDGGCIIGGSTSSTDGDIVAPYIDKPFNILGLSNRSWIFKLDSLGNIEWENRYYGRLVENMVNTPDGGYIFTCYTGKTVMTKIDSLGVIQWRKYLPSLNEESITTTNNPDILLAASNSGFITPGLFSSTTNNVFTLFDTSGQVIEYHPIAITPLPTPGYFSRWTGQAFENSNSNIVIGGTKAITFSYPYIQSFQIEEILLSPSIAVVDIFENLTDTSLLNVLENDIQGPDDSLVVTSVFNLLGNGNIINDSTIRYIAPSASFAGEDFFYYEVCNYKNGVSICDTTIVILYVDSYVSNKEVKVDTDVSVLIYPQPVQNSFTIQLKKETEAIQNLKILGVNGQLLHEWHDLNVNEKRLDVSYFTSGIYFIIVNNKYVKKMIKN